MGNLLSSSATQFLVVLFFIAFYTAPFSSKHFFLGLFVRSLFTQLFFLVVLLLLLLSMSAFSYVGLLSLFWVRLFHAVFPEPPSTQLFSWVFSSEQFAELESVHLLAFWARARSLAFLSVGFPFLGICGAVFDILSSFFGFVLRPFSLQWLCWFQLSKGLISLILLRPILWVVFYRAFLSGSVLSSTPYIGLLCLLRMHAISSCEGDTWQRLWWDDFTHNGKQVVNRLKIPQGLSTLMFRRWSEVPSRGGVRGDSP